MSIFCTVNSAYLKKAGVAGFSLVLLFAWVSAPFAEGSLWEERRQQYQAQQEEHRQALSILQTTPAMTGSFLELRAQSIYGSHLPLDWAQVSDAWQPAQETSRPIVIHIQDAHGLAAAQKNLAMTIDALVTSARNDGKLNANQALPVFLEGAWEDVNPYWLSVYPDRKQLKSVLDEWINSGKMTGEEYYAALHGPGYISLHGIEEKTTYLANWQARQRVDAARADQVQQVQTLLRRLEAIEKQKTSQSYQKKRQIVRGYLNETLSLSEYIQAIYEPSLSHSFPQIEKFAQLQRLENAASLQQIPILTAQLAEALEKKLPSTIWDHFAEQTLAWRAGALSNLAYYTMLLQLAKQAKTTAPVLEQYQRYLALSQELDIATLMQELEAYQTDWMRGAIGNNQTTQQIYDLEIKLLTHLKFWQEKFSPDDWRRYEETIGPRSVLRFRFQEYPTLAEIAQQMAQIENPQALAGNILPDAEAVRQRYHQELYYELAFRRDQIFIDQLENGVAQWPQSPRVIVLIAGGFHTPGIVQHLKERGFPYIVLRPELEEHNLEDWSPLEPHFSNVTFAKESSKESLRRRYLDRLNRLENSSDALLQRHVQDVIQAIENPIAAPAALAEDSVPSQHTLRPQPASVNAIDQLVPEIIDNDESAEPNLLMVAYERFLKYEGQKNRRASASRRESADSNRNPKNAGSILWGEFWFYFGLVAETALLATIAWGMIILMPAGLALVSIVPIIASVALFSWLHDFARGKYSMDKRKSGNELFNWNVFGQRTLYLLLATLPVTLLGLFSTLAFDLKFFLAVFVSMALHYEFIRYEKVKVLKSQLTQNDKGTEMINMIGRLSPIAWLFGNANAAYAASRIGNILKVGTLGFLFLFGHPYAALFTALGLFALETIAISIKGARSKSELLSWSVRLGMTAIFTLAFLALQLDWNFLNYLTEIRVNIGFILLGIQLIYIGLRSVKMNKNEKAPWLYIKNLRWLPTTTIILLITFIPMANEGAQLLGLILLIFSSVIYRQFLEKIIFKELRLFGFANVVKNFKENPRMIDLKKSEIGRIVYFLSLVEDEKKAEFLKDQVKIVEVKEENSPTEVSSGSDEKIPEPAFSESSNSNADSASISISKETLLSVTDVWESLEWANGAKLRGFRDQLDDYKEDSIQVTEKMRTDLKTALIDSLELEKQSVISKLDALIEDKEHSTLISIVPVLAEYRKQWQDKNISEFFVVNSQENLQEDMNTWILNTKHFIAALDHFNSIYESILKDAVAFNHTIENSFAEQEQKNEKTEKNIAFLKEIIQAEKFQESWVEEWMDLKDEWLMQVPLPMVISHPSEENVELNMEEEKKTEDPAEVANGYQPQEFWDSTESDLLNKLDYLESEFSQIQQRFGAALTSAQQKEIQQLLHAIDQAYPQISAGELNRLKLWGNQIILGSSLSVKKASAEVKKQLLDETLRYLDRQALQTTDAKELQQIISRKKQLQSGKYLQIKSKKERAIDLNYFLSIYKTQMQRFKMSPTKKILDWLLSSPNLSEAAKYALVLKIVEELKLREKVAALNELGQFIPVSKNRPIPVELKTQIENFSQEDLEAAILSHIEDEKKSYNDVLPLYPSIVQQLGGTVSEIKKNKKVTYLYTWPASLPSTHPLRILIEVDRMNRQYKGEIVQMDSSGNYKAVAVTPEQKEQFYKENLFLTWHWVKELKLISRSPSTKREKIISSLFDKIGSVARQFISLLKSQLHPALVIFGKRSNEKLGEDGREYIDFLKEFERIQGEKNSVLLFDLDIKGLAEKAEFREFVQSSISIFKENNTQVVLIDSEAQENPVQDDTGTLFQVASVQQLARIAKELRPGPVEYYADQQSKKLLQSINQLLGREAAYFSLKEFVKILASNPFIIIGGERVALHHSVSGSISQSMKENLKIITNA